MPHSPSDPESTMPRSLPLPTTSQVASTTSTVLNHTIPEFYACYLLRSLNKLRGGTYIGSTPDPPRRFKQHSGEITGGAWKTQRGRPWEMEGIVYGFPSKLQALQFEWAWQNPHASRHLHAPPSFLSTASYTTAKEKEKEKPTAQFPKSALSNKPLTKVQVLQFMLTVPPWRAFGLKVLLFSDDAKGWWDEARRLGPVARTEAGVRKWKAERGKKGTVGDDPWGGRGRVLDETVIEVRREGVDGRRLVRAGEVEEAEAKERIRVDDHDFFDPHWTAWTSLAESTLAPTCAVCSKPVDPDDHLSFLLCTSSSSDSSSSAASPSSPALPATPCTSTFHLPCLAAHFLSTPSPSSAASTLALPSAAPAATTSPPLLPIASSCPSCHSPLLWVDLIRASYRRKEEQEGRRKRRTFEKGSKDPEARKRKKRVAAAAGVEGEEREKTKGRKPRGRGKGKATAAVDSGSEGEERFDFDDKGEDDGAESVDLDEVGEEDDDALEEQERSWAQSAAAEGAFLDDLDLEGGGGGDMDVDDWIEDAPPPPVSPKKRGRPPKAKSPAASPPRTAPTASPRRRATATKKPTKVATLTSTFGSSKASLSTSAAGAAGGKGKTRAIRPASDSEDDFLAPLDQLGRQEPEKGKEKAATARKKKVLEYVELSD